jgi:hypothetical protein
MPQSNGGANVGRDCENELIVYRLNSITPYFQKSIRTERCTFIYWKHPACQSVGLRIVAPRSAWALWLTCRRVNTQEGRWHIAQNTLLSRVMLRLGLRHSIGFVSVANGRMLTIYKHLAQTGKYSFRTRALTMKCGTGFRSALRLSILEREK